MQNAPMPNNKGNFFSSIAKTLLIIVFVGLVFLIFLIINGYGWAFLPAAFIFLIFIGLLGISIWLSPTPKNPSPQLQVTQQRSAQLFGKIMKWFMIGIGIMILVATAIIIGS